MGTHISNFEFCRQFWLVSYPSYMSSGPRETEKKSDSLARIALYPCYVASSCLSAWWELYLSVAHTCRFLLIFAVDVLTMSEAIMPYIHKSGQHMTKFQYQKHGELVQELKQMRQGGEKNQTILNA